MCLQCAGCMGLACVGEKNKRLTYMSNAVQKIIENIIKNKVARRKPRAHKIKVYRKGEWHIWVFK